MRTNIELDEEALAELMAITGARTKKQAVNEAIHFHLRSRKAAKAVLDLAGTVKWEGNLDQMRRDS
ncbi:MAG: DUF2191 domain-containing protein [Alphaproteobacteria bacterium]|nr:MAG: DUF2191 domain-containing protein [Alphaproteobacteria bacterium]